VWQLLDLMQQRPFRAYPVVTPEMEFLGTVRPPLHLAVMLGMKTIWGVKSSHDDRSGLSYVHDA
jgi:hypothetical protein